MDSVVLAASLQAASISVGQSVALVIAGWIVCRKRMKGGTQTVRDVTQSLVWVFSPCLSVTNLVSTLTLEKLLALWLLPVFSCEPASAAVGRVKSSATCRPRATIRKSSRSEI